MQTTLLLSKPKRRTLAVDSDEATNLFELAEDVRSSMAAILANAGNIKAATEFNPGRLYFAHRNLQLVDEFIGVYAPIVKRFNVTGEFSTDLMPDVSRFQHKE